MSKVLNGSVREFTTAIASGDTDAFAAFFRRRFSEMYTEARRATGRDESFCLDIVQDAMVRVIRSMKPVETEERLRAWLRVVVQTCAYDRLRKEARRRRWEVAGADVRCVDGKDEKLGEKLEWLRGELATLDDPHVQMLVMRYRLGWTLQRIGAALGLKPGAVHGRLGRLIASLRRRAQETFSE